jgi:DNA-binding protein
MRTTNVLPVLDVLDLLDHIEDHIHAMPRGEAKNRALDLIDIARSEVLRESSCD